MDSEQTDDYEHTVSNGYLRQGEFRRWARGVDSALRDMASKVGEHSEILAVLRDRRVQGDLRRNTIGAAIAAAVAAIVSAVLQHWH